MPQLTDPELQSLKEIIYPRCAGESKVVDDLRALVTADNDDGLREFFTQSTFIINSHILLKVLDAVPVNPDSDINQKLLQLKNSLQDRDVRGATVQSLAVQYLLANPDKIRTPSGDADPELSRKIRAIMRQIPVSFLPALLDWNRLLTQVRLENFEPHCILQHAVACAENRLRGFLQNLPVTCSQPWELRLARALSLAKTLSSQVAQGNTSASSAATASKNCVRACWDAMFSDHGGNDKSSENSGSKYRTVGTAVAPAHDAGNIMPQEQEMGDMRPSAAATI